jgi:hypothetical protein
LLSEPASVFEIIEAQGSEPMLQQRLMARAAELAGQLAQVSPLRMRVILLAVVHRVDMRRGERPGANAIDIATVISKTVRINKTARGTCWGLDASRRETSRFCERATSWPNTIGRAVENGNSGFLLNLPAVDQA